MAGRKRKSFYVTTPIYYVNDVPHIGHAYTTIAADVIARYKRLTGHEVFFLTGTDEHGQKVEKAAAERGESPKQLADRVMTRFQKLWERLNISNDKFIRTTDSDHYEAVTAFFKKVQEKGDIYLGQYEDWYCISDEAYWTELQLVNGKCPSCGRPVEKIKEESYFFRMSNYQKQLLRLLRKQLNFIKPQSRRNEVTRFVEGGLRDLSISRVSFRWGIPVPNDDRHVIYVWFDALTNYLTAIGFGKDQKTFNRFWPANVHIIGKDILRFHAVYWPCFLFSAGLKLPKQIFSHGWWTVDGEKMSKSKGNVVAPDVMIDRYGVDPFRYFLLREVPFGEDGDFSEHALVQRINSELANDLGNLFSRALAMLERYHHCVIPKPSVKNLAKPDRQLSLVAKQLYPKVQKEMDGLQFHSALKEIWRLVDLANRYIEQSAPWDLAKSPSSQARLKTVLYNSAETLRILSLYLFPFMPMTAQEMAKQLGQRTDWGKINLKTETKWGRLKPGTKIEKGSQLFPRIETNQIVDLQARGSTQRAEAPMMIKKEKTVQTETVATEQISIQEFQKIHLRAGKVESAENIPGSEKLLKLIVDLGTEKRQVVAGIAKRYSPADLLGKKVIVVTNLKPAKLMGIESQGMILAAGDQEDLSLATFLEDVPPGSKVK
jgi:methionyl-tRNA synthetase